MRQNYATLGARIALTRRGQQHNRKTSRMNQKDWEEIEELYCAALECEPAERAALLSAVPPEIHHIVQRMLAASAGDTVLDRMPWIDSEPESPRMTLDTGSQLGPYTILGLIGEGGMGLVYRASDSRLNREVAIKILPHALIGNESRMRQFETEARAAGSLNHPNILTVHDVGSHDGMFYLVAELLEGETLRDRLRRGELSRPETLAHTRMIAAGLAAAHEKGIIHSDLKPENIFCMRDGRLKILDFGLAKFSASVDAPSAVPAVLVGTVGYMSPEQVQGRPIDTRSDIFNLGIVVFEMLAGYRPFSGATMAATFEQIQQREPQLDALPGMDAAFERFLRRCLEKDASNRFQSAAEILPELDKLDAPAIYSRRRVALYLGSGLAVAAGLVRIRSRPAVSAPIRHQLTYGSRGNIATGRFAPDGRSVVYSASWGGNPIETFQKNIDGGDSISLGIPLAGVAGISAKGDLALLLRCELNWGECQGRLAHRPLAGGEVREIDGFDDTTEFADWSPSGDLAVVRFDRRGQARIEYPVGNLLYATPRGWISHLRFSPKGDRLAFLNHPNGDDNNGSVDVIDLAANRKTLVSNRQSLKGLAWTPSGEEVWFSGSSHGRLPELRAVSLNGRERIVYNSSGWLELLDIASDGRVLMMGQTPTSWIVYDPQRALDASVGDWATIADVSPDGSQLLIYEWGASQEGRQAASLRDTVRGGTKHVGEGKPLALSPDGQWVLAVRLASNPELVLYPVKSGQERRLTSPGVAAFRSGLWQDNKNVIFVGEAADGAIRSYIQPIDGGPARPIAGPGVWVALVSPERQELAALGRGGAYYRLSIDGVRLPPFRGLEDDDELLQWGRDGVLYVRGRGENSIHLFRVDLVTGRRTRWKSLMVPDPVGLVGIGNIKITPDGNTLVYNYWKALGDLYWFEGLL